VDDTVVVRVDGDGDVDVSVRGTRKRFRTS
jgi:hypothetical protein